METYEIAYILHPDLKDEEALQHSQKIKDSILEKSGEIKEEGSTKKKQLAYAVKKQRYGYFNFFQFTAEPKIIPDFDKKIKLDKSILRHLIIKITSKQLRELKEQKEKPRVERVEKVEKADSPKLTTKIKEKRDPIQKVDIAELDKKLEEILK